MDSYIEITWFTGFLVLMHSSTLAFYVAWKPQSFLRLLGYSIAIPFLAILCFHPSAWCFMIALEAFFFWKIYRHAWETWLIMIANRLLWNMTCYVFYGGSFHVGIYFVPMETIPWLLWGILFGSWLLLYHKWKAALAQYDFIYPLRVVTSNVQLKLRGYLDTGNLLSSEGIPVIFLDVQYASYFHDESIELVVMNTVDATKVIRCHEVKAKVGDGRFHKVLVNSEKNLQLPMGCNALLNMNMMTQE